MDIGSIKTRYFKEQIEKGIHDVFGAQRQIAEEKIYCKADGSRRLTGGRSVCSHRSGALRDALTNPRYRFDVSDGVKMETSVPVYIRFLDMRRNGNLRIYNPPIWGILYSETLRNIKYEFRDWLKKNFTDLVDQIYNNK